MLKFYFHQTPNPTKVALFLEETGLPYELLPVDTLKGEQHTPQYREINPNGKTPAIDDDGKRVFDSNAILIYLSEKTGNRYLREAERHYEVLDTHMEGREYIVGDEYSIADISAWGWIDKASVVLGEEGLENYPNVKRWFATINARPAIERARNIAKDIHFKSTSDEESKRALYPQNYDKNA